MSASVTPNDQLKLFWDNFFHSETGTYEKSSWLDLFLAEYLLQLKDGGDPHTLLSFCPIGSIVTLVGCELLCGVHCVTSSSCSQYAHLAAHDYTRDCSSPLPIANNKTASKNNESYNLPSILPQGVSQNYANVINNASSVQALKKFLLKGSAWRCLALLQSLGVEGLSCSRQLSGVLVWLYGELSGAGGVCHGPNAYLPCPTEKPPIYDLFVNKIWTKKNATNFLSVRSSGNNNSTSGNNSRSRRKTQGKKTTQENNQQNTATKKTAVNQTTKNSHQNKRQTHSSDSSDSKQNSDELEVLNRSFTLKAKLNRNDFDYFSANIRSEEDNMLSDTLYSPIKKSSHKKKPVIEDYTSDKHRTILNSEISQYEFSEMAINLLYQLCKSETNTSDSEALHISVQCINFSLKYLCTLQFESSPASHVNLTSSEATQLKTSLTELLILSFDKVLTHSDLFNKIISNGILPMLLRLLEDATYKLQVRLNMTSSDNSSSTNTSQETIDKLEASNWVKYLFGISYSILVFFYCLLMQQSSLGKIHEFVEQFKLFGDCRHGFILKDTINLMLRIPGTDEHIVSALIKKLIVLINSLINTLKLVRSELVHSATCPRNKHKICRSKVLQLMQHHHDILGTSFCHSGNMSLSPVCSVSILYATLASLLSDDLLIQSPVLRTKLLKSMRSCGSCCCFSPQFLLDKVVKIIQTHNSLSNLCFLILEQTLYGELGVMNNSNATQVKTFYKCSVCDNYFTPDVGKSSQINQLFRSTSHVIKDSPIRGTFKHSLSENDSLPNMTSFKVTWPFLSKYIPLLQAVNVSMLHTTMNHLLKMSIFCKLFVKHDLLFCVLYPAFVMAKSRYLLTNNDCSYFVTKSCLNAFANLLSYPIFAKEFIQKGGLNDILDLIALPEFSKHCCSILEIATITEIFMSTNEINDKSYATKLTQMSFGDVDKLPSLQMLIKSLENITRKAFIYFKLRVDQKIYNDIVNVSELKETSEDEVDAEHVRKTKSALNISKPISIKGSNRSQTVAIHGMQHFTIEQSMTHHMEVLKSISIFWKTCCALCLYSPSLRKYFVKKRIFQDSLKMFKLLLHCITKVSSTQTEHKLLMKILETIVTVHVVVSDDKMEKSKLPCVELLKTVLLADDDSVLDLNNVKLLCDVLVKVAATKPSNVHVMPPKNKIKLPPMHYPSHNSDDNHSSSGEEEESKKLHNKKPYTSEGSETYHSADEGYEADVEVCVVDSSVPADAELDHLINYNNSSGVLKNTLLSVVSNTDPVDIDYTEYQKLNVVTYPDLCYVVLNVALNLIDRILKNEEKCPDPKTNSPLLFNVVCSCLNKMSTIFFHDMSGSSVSGFVSQILHSPSARLLKRPDTNFEELQNSLLKLFCTLATKSITPDELKSYLSLLNDSQVPLNILLTPLQKLSETVYPNVPDFIVCFPVDSNMSAVISHSGQQTTHDIHQGKDGSTTPPHTVETYPLALHGDHIKAGIRSCWSKMGMWCSINGVNWGLWLEGCSIAMWMMLRDTQTHSRTQSKTSFYTTSDDSNDEGELADSQNIDSQAPQWSRRKGSNTGEDVINRQSESDTDILNILHLVSIGHDSVMIEFWVNVVNGDILIQLTRPSSDCNNIIGEGVLKNCVDLKSWNHLTINVKEVTHKKTFCIEVKAFVNGFESSTHIPLTGVLLHRIRPAYLVVGHSTPNDLSPSSRPRGSWFLSNMTVFRAPIISRYMALYLMAHGPDIKPLTSCQVGNQIPNFGPLFTPAVMESNIDWDQVLAMSSDNIMEMKDNLLLTYSASSPTTVDIYHKTTSHQSVFRLTSPTKGGSASMPAPRNVHWMGQCLSSQHNGFSPSIYLIGGPNVLLYLFARIVELESNSEIQANVLSILFKVSLTDTRLHSMFQQDQLLNMLHIVFASQKCQMDYYLLKALIDASCDRPILVKENNKFKLSGDSNVIIKHPEILITAIKSWKQLDNAVKPSLCKIHKQNQSTGSEDIDNELLQGKAKGTLVRTIRKSVCMEGTPIKDTPIICEEDGLLGVLLQCIIVMLKDSNPYRHFNVYQLNRYNMVDTLLMFCKERFLYSDFGPLNEGVGYNLVELIRSLMGCPPCIHHMALITDFLILMHECSSTYITHSRACVYFLLSEESIKNKGKYSVEMLGMSSAQAAALEEIKGKYVQNVPEPESKSVTSQPSNAIVTQADETTKPEVTTATDDVTSDPAEDVRTDEITAGDVPEAVVVPTDSSQTAEGDVVSENVASEAGPSTSPKNYETDALRPASPSKTSPSKCPRRKISTSQLDTSTSAEVTAGTAECSSCVETLDLTKEYDIIRSDEVAPEKSPLMIYQKLRSPVLLRNLRTCSTRSWTICEGLLLLMRDTITNMPDTYLPQMLGIVLRTEMLLVLANHPEACVRSGVVKVVGAILQRCSAEEVKRFHERHFFHNLANQISQKDASYELVSACVSLVTGRRATIEDQLEEEAWQDVKEHQISLSLPLIAILTPTLHDVSLTHNTTLLFRKIISLSSVKAIVSIGMVESIIRCLRHIGSILDADFDGRDLLLNDMRELLNMILLKVLLTDKNSHLYLDMYNTLLFLDMMERQRSNRHLERCHVLTTIRDTYCYLVTEELNFFQDMLAIAYNERLGKSPSAVAITASDLEAVESGPSTGGLSKSAPSSSVLHSMNPSRRIQVALTLPEDARNEYSRSEIRDRIMALLKRVTNFFTNREWNLKVSPYETTTAEIIFILVISIASGVNHRFPLKWWKKLMNNQCHDILWELFMWMISPKQVPSLKMFVVQTVFDSWLTIKKILTPNEPKRQRQLAVYLSALVKYLPNDEAENEQSLKKFVQTWVTSLEPHIQYPEAMEGEIKYLLRKDDERRESAIVQSFDAMLKSVLSKDDLVESIVASAMTGTQGVVQTQNAERKIFMDQIKKQEGINVSSCHKWQKLLDIFGHERGVWFDKESCPMSWELDPTEGPAKVRIRLRRCHIDVDEKFLKTKSKYKVDLSKKPQPLSYLFTWSMQSDYLDCLHMNEVISYMTPAVYVTVKCEQEGEVVVSDRCIHFFSDDKNDVSNISGIYLPLDNITIIQKRRWRLSERAVEITLSSGRAHFLAFKGDKELDEFLKILDGCTLPMRQNADSLSACANLWRNGEITNWEYLMQLNTLAGRTYNDLMQYPVLPFVLADYSSPILDLTRADSYRNLKKPVAVQDTNHARTYIDNYNNLKVKNEERRRENPSNIGGFTDEPFHYGSHYSNSATVLHFLVRLPPFTKQFILFQDGNFDMPDRTFHSINTAWRLSACVSQSSCKELTPEFFYQPRIFTNDEDFNFGTRQSGMEVNHVDLPKWCPNPRIFTLVHRQALENPHVRENIPHWIDLIFGYKQTGDAAVEALNVYHPSTYHGYKPTLEDNVQKDALDAMIRTYGQTPRQLLKLPHPQCITNLKHVPEAANRSNVLSTVSGLRWGYYCGSPQLTTPWLVWTRKIKPVLSGLIPLLTGEVLGIPSQTTVMVIYSKTSTTFANSGNGTTIAAVAVITWGHSDGIIRIKQKKDSPPEPLFQVQNLDQVTVIAHSVGSTMGGLWIGLQSGRIAVLHPTPIYSTPPIIAFSRRPTYLFGHNSAIMSICINTSFGVAVSACKEGAINVWDLHSLVLVRAIPSYRMPLSIICLSETLCDICTVHDKEEIVRREKSESEEDGSSTPTDSGTSRSSSTSSHDTPGANVVAVQNEKRLKPKFEKIPWKSKIRLQTINGVFVGEVKLADRVTSICYSNAPEGVSVNTIVVGLETGHVKFYSSWDLSNITTLLPMLFSGPVSSMSYSYDSHHLYCVGYDGTVMVWESDSIKGKTASFRQLSSLPIF